MDTSQFQRHLTDRLLLLLQHTEQKALVLFGLNGLLMLGLLMTDALKLATIVAGVAALSALITVLPGGDYLLYNEAATHNFDMYWRTVRTSTEQSISEELTRSCWYLDRRLKQKFLCLNITLMLTVAAVCLLLFSLI